MLEIKEFAPVKSKAGIIQHPETRTAAMITENKNIDLYFYGRIPSKKNGQQIKWRYTRRGKIPFISPGEKHEKRKTQEKKRLQNLFLQIRSAGVQLPIKTTQKIKITLFVPDKIRTDTINKAESLLDIMTDGGIIKDDNTEVIPLLILDYEYRKNAGGALVKIKT